MTDKKLDDTATYYLNAGIIDDPSEITECVHCGFNLMPWYMRCEACGSTEPYTPKVTLWQCGNCYYDEHESEHAAEMCCAWAEDEEDWEE